MLLVGGPAAVAAVSAWALVADDKIGWTVVSGVLAALTSAFAPSAMQWWLTRQARHHQGVPPAPDALVAGLPEQVAWLLDPRQAVVGFVGRGWVLRQLETWCADPRVLAVRLVVGGGGVGKTRLALHFAERLTGWQHWAVAPQGEPHVAAALQSGKAPERLLLTVDYAETRDPHALARLLCTAQDTPGVRVLLLARRAGLWWETLSAAYPPQAHVVDALTVPGTVIELPAEVENHEPEQIIAEAVAAFSARLRQPPPAELRPGPYEPGTPVLRLHAEALLAVLGGPASDGRHDVLAEVLRHEARYWRACARRAGIGESSGAAAMDALLRQLVGIGVLLGAADERQTRELVRRAPLLAGAGEELTGACAGWLRSLYPAAGRDGPLGTLQPDLLAEALAVDMLTDCTPAERTAILRGLTATQAAQALTVLGRAASHRREATTMIDAALAADVPRMTEAVLEVGLLFPGRFAARAAALLATAPVDPGWAADVVDRLPSPSLELSQVGLALTTRILEESGPAMPAGDRATWLNRHAIALARSGRREAALAAGAEAVELYRVLAGNDPGAYLADLATSVRSLAHGRAAAGRPEEALAASAEAVDLYRELAATHGHSYRAGLATAVYALAVTLADAGRREEALAASAEAVDLYRELAAGDRDAHLADLAASVNNLAVGSADAGRREEALAASAEAVELYRELAAGDPGAFLADLATSVTNLAADLAEAGRGPEAARAGLEAVHLYRRLTTANGDAYLPHLADALSNCAVVLARVGRGAEALATSTEAVQVRRELAALNRDAYLGALAMSLKNHANRLAEAGRRSEALAAATETVALYRELAGGGGPAHVAGLATALWNAGAVSLAAGHVDEGVVALTAEGVRVLTGLAAADPGAFAGRRDAAAATLDRLRSRLREPSGAGPGGTPP